MTLTTLLRFGRVPVEFEPAPPDDQRHRAADELNLTVAGCPCRRCAGLRDRSLVASYPFGFEGDDALAAMARMNRRVAREGG